MAKHLKPLLTWNERVHLSGNLAIMDSAAEEPTQSGLRLQFLVPNFAVKLCEVWQLNMKKHF